MSETDKLVFCVLSILGIVLALTTLSLLKTTRIEDRLDKCCLVKTEEKNTVVQSDVERRTKLVQAAKAVEFLNEVGPKDAAIWIAGHCAKTK